MYGITIYGSNPILNNVSIINPSRVGVDLFSSANPTINDLLVDQAGRGFTYADWRYGIGLSVGAGSSPIVEGAVLTDARIRGLNIWGDSGGIYRQITIDNITAEGAIEKRDKARKQKDYVLSDKIRDKLNSSQIGQ